MGLSADQHRKDQQTLSHRTVQNEEHREEEKTETNEQSGVWYTKPSNIHVFGVLDEGGWEGRKILKKGQICF